jgi:hypothetical protein
MTLEAYRREELNDLQISVCSTMTLGGGSSAVCLCVSDPTAEGSTVKEC